MEIFLTRAEAQPYKPGHAQEVLERIRPETASAAWDRLQSRRQQLKADPANLPLATEVARELIQAARQERNARYWSYAESALKPWWRLEAPPMPVRLLRAILLQHHHQFEPALADLMIVTQQEPRNAQAWLTRASVLQVLGRYDEAKRCVLALTACASELVSVVSAAHLASLTGQAEGAFDLLQQTLERPFTASHAEWCWAWTTLGEIARRLGKNEEARKCFQTALDHDARDEYLLAVYADFLLDQGLAGEAIALLEKETNSDPLLLRLALAYRIENNNSKALGRLTSQLQARFRAGRLRGDPLHLREEAMFQLRLLDDPEAALPLALSNWEAQREPADARILLECALACDNKTAVLPVIQWIDRNRWQDVALNSLKRELGL